MPLICEAEVLDGVFFRPDFGAKKEEIADCLQIRACLHFDFVVDALLLGRLDGLAPRRDSAQADASSMTLSLNNIFFCSK